jgi:hypothetical protein
MVAASPAKSQTKEQILPQTQEKNPCEEDKTTCLSCDVNRLLDMRRHPPAHRNGGRTIGWRTELEISTEAADTCRRFDRYHVDVLEKQAREILDKLLTPKEKAYLQKDKEAFKMRLGIPLGSEGPADFPNQFGALAGCLQRHPRSGLPSSEDLRDLVVKYCMDKEGFHFCSMCQVSEGSCTSIENATYYASCYK